MSKNIIKRCNVKNAIKLSALAILAISFMISFANAHTAFAAGPGLINGTVYVDSNLNGIKDGGEIGKKGWPITLSGTFTNGTVIPPITQNSSATGTYAFNKLSSGNYTVTESEIVGWGHTSPKSFAKISITSGTLVTKNFGNVQLGAIAARPFNDINANGIQDAGESLVSGWNVALTGTLVNGTVIIPINISSSPTAVFSNLYPGTYSLTETNQAGFAQSTPNPVTSIVLSSGGSVSINFGNIKLGIITARPFNDSNSNGIQDAGESLVSGWTISLMGKFSNGTNTPTVNIVSSPTAIFSNIYPGNYNLTEADQSGFTHTTPSIISNIFISGAGNNTSFNFGNKKTSLPANSAINGTVFLDSNLNGVFDAGELGKKSWPITLNGTLNNGTILLPMTINSSFTGSFSFIHLSPGTYTLTESDISGWVHDSPSVVNNIALNANSLVTENFGNVQPSTITARPFNDINANGIQDGSEGVASGWNFTLTGTFSNGTVASTIQITSSPIAVFSNIYPGNYSLTEADKPGFTHTTPSTISNIIENATASNTAYNFGNLQPSAIKAKVYNDTNGDLNQDGGEKPLSNWSVTLTQNGVTVASGLTDVNGTVLFSPLSPGIYNVTAATPGLYVHTQPLNGTYSVNVTNDGTLHLVSLGVFNETPDLLTGFGDIVSIAPESIAMDSQGFIYDTDTTGNQIKKFATNGTLVMAFGTLGSGHGQFSNPSGIAIDSQDNIYVSDVSRVQKFDSHANFIMQFGSTGSSPGQFQSPRGISVDSNGDIYVADGNNHRIEKFDKNGNYLLTIGKPGVPYSYLRLPFDVKVTNSSTIFVADTGNNRVQKFDVNGTWLGAFGHFGHDNGELLRPRNVATDSNGFIYVSDTYNNRVQVFDSDFNWVRTIGSLGSDPGQFLNPSGIMVDKNGIIYVADISNDRIESFDNNGTFLSQFRTRLSQIEPYFTNFDQQGHILVADGHNHKVLGFNATSSDLLFTISQLGTNPGDLRGPRGIGIDSQGDIIVAEDYNNRVSIFDKNGTFIKTFGSTGSGPGQFKQPRGLLIDSSGNILVADTQNNRIEKFDSNGNYLTSFTTTLPYQIAFDSQGNIYSADETADYIEKLAPNGTSLAKFGTNGTAPGQFQVPRGVYVDNSGNIYVADSGNNRIQEFDSNFNLITILGSGGTGNGQFNDPRTVQIDSSGNLWVCDTGNLRLQEFDNHLNFVKTITFAFGNTTSFGPILTADPPGGSYSSTQHVTLSVEDDPSTIYYTTDGSTPTQSSTKYTGTPITISVTTTLNAFAIDVAGAVGNALSQTYTIGPTTSTPTVNIIAPTNGTIVKSSTLLINGTASDVNSTLQKVEASVDGGSFNLASGTTNWSFAFNSPFDGSHNIVARATDNLGNTATSSVTITVDTQAPTVSITTPVNGSTAGTSSLVVTGTAFDFGTGIQNVQVSVDSGAFNLATGTNSWSFNTATLANGLHLIQAKATDNAGNVAISKINVNVNVVQPPVTFSVTNAFPRWGLDSVSVSGNVTGTVSSGDTITLAWGDGVSTTGISITGGKWGPVSHIYPSSAVATNPNLIIATWKSSSHVTKGTSPPFPIMISPHATKIVLTQAPNLPWGKSTSFTATLTDFDAGGVPISGRTIHFTGTGVIGVADKSTSSTGIATSTGTAPNTVASGWTYQARFAGDSLYIPIVSTTKTYSTLKHSTQLTLSVPISVTHGSTYSVSGTLTDAVTGTTISSETITFTAKSPIVIPNTVTDSIGNFNVGGLIAPSAGSYKIQSHFAGDSLHSSSNSTQKTLSVT